MNFKFTKIKAACSIGIGLIAGVYALTKAGCIGSCSWQSLLPMQVQSLILGALVFFVPIYVIWSIFEKK